jgi:Integrase core domain
LGIFTSLKFTSLKEPDFKCEECIAAKMERASHPRSAARASTQCGLLHTDLMCPKEGGLLTEDDSYVLTVMDDFSRYAEVAILSSKGEAASVFQKMAKRMERQTATKVQQVRFDRSKEYAGLKEWMHAEGNTECCVR